MFIPFANETIFRKRAPYIRDRYNAEIRDWANATSTMYNGVHVQPQFSEELSDIGAQQTTDTYWCFLPPDSDVIASDRIVWTGDTYEVQGNAQKWPDPINGGVAYRLVVMKLIEGSK